MSQSTTADHEERVVKARVRDPQLLRALDDAEGDRTLSDIVRSGVRVELLGGGESNGDGDGVDPLALQGWEALMEVKRPGDTVRLEVAENVIAQKTQISGNYVRDTILTPLQTAGVIGVKPQAIGDKVMIEIGNDEPRPVAADTVKHGHDCGNCPNTARFLIQREHPLTGAVSGSVTCVDCAHASGAFPYEDNLIGNDVSDDARRDAGYSVDGGDLDA